MPGAIAFVEKSSIITLRVDSLAPKKKSSGLNTGSFIDPGAGAPVPGTLRILSAGSGASSSPIRASSTDPVNWSLRETENVGPSVGLVVVAGRVIRDGGVIEKSGIAFTVPS